MHTVDPSRFDASQVRRTPDYEYRFEQVAEVLHEVGMTSITRQNLGEVWFRYLLAMRLTLGKKLDFAVVDDLAFRQPRSRSLPEGAKSLTHYIGLRTVGREVTREAFQAAHLNLFLENTRNTAESQASEVLR